MQKTKKFTIALTSKDYVDITLHLKNGKISKFALNYRALIKNKWREIYRVDNFHGFLHEQKFWRTNKSIPLQENITTETLIEEYTELIIDNFERYKKYYEEAKK